MPKLRERGFGKIGNLRLFNNHFSGYLNPGCLISDLVYTIVFTNKWPSHLSVSFVIFIIIILVMEQLHLFNAIHGVFMVAEA